MNRQVCRFERQPLSDRPLENASVRVLGGRQSSDLERCRHEAAQSRASRRNTAGFCPKATNRRVLGCEGTYSPTRPGGLDRLEDELVRTTWPAPSYAAVRSCLWCSANTGAVKRCRTPLPPQIRSNMTSVLVAVTGPVNTLPLNVSEDLVGSPLSTQDHVTGSQRRNRAAQSDVRSAERW